MQQYTSNQDHGAEHPAEDFNPLGYREPDEAANDNEPEEGLNARDITLITRGVHMQTPANDDENWSHEDAPRGELDFAENRVSRRGFLDERF